MDKIAYLSVSNGGGMDGMDHTDKGGKIMDAKWSESELKLTPWTHLEKRIVEFPKSESEILKDLDPLKKLILKDYFIRTNTTATRKIDTGAR